jgi:glutamine amidotransferase
MCRLLLIKSETETETSSYLQKFARIARNSREYQGHGWGCAYLIDGKWEIYKNIKPIWEDSHGKFPSTTLLLAHARSAFRDEGIQVENNMPFFDDHHIFIFNGELHGVKIKAEGRIGAEKIFNTIKRFDKGDMLAAIKKAVEIIKKRSNYIRAMNLIIADKQKVYLHSLFNEDPEYFSMYSKRTKNDLIICSDEFPGEEGWNKIENNTTEVF